MDVQVQHKYNGNMKTKIPSEEERIVLYKRLLDYFNEYKLETAWPGGFCKALSIIKYRSRCKSSASYCQKVEDFPELIKFKPKSNYFPHWFDGNNVQIRIDILKQILTEMIK